MPDVLVPESGVELPRGPTHLGSPEGQIFTLVCTAGPSTLEQSTRGGARTPLTTLNVGDYVNVQSDAPGDWLHATGGSVWLMSGDWDG